MKALAFHLFTLRGLIAWWLVAPLLGRLAPQTSIMSLLLPLAGDWIYRRERREWPR